MLLAHQIVDCGGRYLILKHLITDLRLFVGEDAGIHEHLIRDLLSVHLHDLFNHFICLFGKIYLICFMFIYISI